MKKVISLFLTAVLLLFAGTALAANEEALPALQTFIQTLRSMEFPIADAAAHSEKVKKADASLDLEDMGKKALGPHWKEAAPEQQKEFMELLWKLIENIAYSRSRKFLGDLPVQYGEPKPVERGVEIETTVQKEEEALNAPITYDLEKQAAGWKIYDIFLDGVTITEDLKFQFDQIIADSGFAGLLQRMRERLAKAEQENTQKA